MMIDEPCHFLATARHQTSPQDCSHALPADALLLVAAVASNWHGTRVQLLQAVVTPRITEVVSATQCCRVFQWCSCCSPGAVTCVTRSWQIDCHQRPPVAADQW